MEEDKSTHFNNKNVKELEDNQHASKHTEKVTSSKIRKTLYELKAKSNLYSLSCSKRNEEKFNRNISNTGFNKNIQIKRKYVEFMNLQNLKQSNISSIMFLSRFFNTYIRLASDIYRDGKYVLLNEPLKRLFKEEADEWYQRNVIDKQLNKPHIHKKRIKRGKCDDNTYKYTECDGDKHQPIDFDRFNYTDLPKVISCMRERSSNNANPSDSIIHLGNIPKPEHLDEISIFFKNTSLMFQFHKTSFDKLNKLESSFEKEFLKLKQKFKNDVDNARLQWTVMGLTSLKTIEVNSLDVNNASIDEKIVILKIYGGDEDLECCICLDNDKDVVFKPCGHYACCSECVSWLQSNKKPCPLCRSYFIEVVHINEINNNNNKTINQHS